MLNLPGPVLVAGSVRGSPLEVAPGEIQLTLLLRAFAL